MIKILSKIGALFLLVSGIGCAGPDNASLKPEIPGGTDETVIKIADRKSDYALERIPFSEFVDSVRFIPLETTDENIIKSIKTVVFHKGELIVIDNGRSEIYFFDEKGKYKRKISRRGRGPGEYLVFTVCQFDEKREIFTIYDSLQSKLLELDMEGTCLRELPEFSENADIRELYRLPDGHYLCYTYNQFSGDVGRYSGLWETDSNGVFVKNLFQYEVELYPTYNPYASNFIVLPDGTVCLRDQMHNDVYKYEKGNLRRWITFENEDYDLSSIVGEPLSERSPIKNSCTQVKGPYIFIKWSECELRKTCLVFYGIMPLADPSAVRYTDWELLMDPAFAAFATGLGMVDNNCPDLLIMNVPLVVLSMESAKSYISRPARDSLERITAGMDEEEIRQSNPVLELLYVKSGGGL